jgi:hypothetical protein
MSWHKSSKTNAGASHSGGGEPGRAKEALDRAMLWSEWMKHVEDIELEELPFIERPPE